MSFTHLLQKVTDGSRLQHMSSLLQTTFLHQQTEKDRQASCTTIHHLICDAAIAASGGCALLLVVHVRRELALPGDCGGVETTPFFRCGLIEQLACLAAEAVQGPALPLQGIHHIKGGDSLAPGVLGVGHCIPDDILQEHLHGGSLPELAQLLS